MKKTILLLSISTLMLLFLSGCFTSTFNRLGHEDTLIYENEDHTIRLEIGMETSSIGRLSVVLDNVLHTFVAEYIIIQEYINVYIASPGVEDSIFSLSVSFEVVDFFKLDYDKMYLKESTNLVNNSEHEIFTGFDVQLNRDYDTAFNPLNYFDSKWKTEDETVLFINDKLDYYYSNTIKGTLNGEDVWIAFQNQTFTIWRLVDLNMMLSGSFYFEAQNIVIEPFEWYTDYPSKINLVFAKNNA